MTPEVAMSEITRGLEMALVLGAPPLLAVLGVGVVVGVVQPPRRSTSRRSVSS